MNLKDEPNAILCVDDEPIILISLVQELKNKLGREFIFETAQDATEALEVIDDLVSKGTKVVLIVSDWLMPITNGDEFLIQVHKKYPEIPSILVTGHIEKGIFKKVQQEARTCMIIPKPWNSEELLKVVRKFCYDTK
ncbi:response regulator receiver domain protein [Leptospira interrogans serovar Valbuzzi str. Duyster]|uniref:response regulator n=1 Tax=Leptospira interrogans TaxID=173 RepID=UPI0002BEB37C|nr:response regulator [Leptospira interrogans]EMJ53686.1 response regulator receiver domain protein [Leptospira interrogans serovar Valbuzzi str. Duyster]ENO74139.1 response regulator receiver domain protein [Leptospira interrogans serovar Valbuzzi str. Valbuzzi]